MIQTLLIVLLVCFIAVFVYIKIKYPFWNIQPVFHTYDYWRYFYRIPFIVYKQRPIKTKFYDLNQIQTIPYLECSQQQQIIISNLLQCYYISNEHILHNVTNIDIHAFLTGHSEPVYISFYNEPKYATTIDIHNDSIICSQHSLGIILSKPAIMYFRPTLTEDIYTEIPIYYLDYLCINREQDQKKISRKLIQTHEYNQRIKNPSIQISILKKEIDLFEGVIPLVEYITTTYYLRNINFPKLPSHFHVSQITKENMDLLTDFLYLFTSKNEQNEKTEKTFDICIIPNIGNIIALINQQLLYVYCVRHGKTIYGFYFIKDAKTQYEDIDDSGGNTLQCIGSVMNYENYTNTITESLFYLGFLHSLQQIIKKNQTYKMLLIEDINHNTILLKYWRTKHTPIFTNKTAYYSYNFIYPCSPLYPEKCLILL